MTNYRKLQNIGKPSEQPSEKLFKTIQYHFHDVAEYETISPKKGKNSQELPAIKWDVAMVTALIQKLQPTHKLYFNSTHTGKSLQLKL